MYVVVLPKTFNLKLIKNKTQNQVVEHSIRLLTGLTPHNVRVIKDQKTKRKEKERKEKKRKKKKKRKDKTRQRGLFQFKGD